MIILYVYFLLRARAVLLYAQLLLVLSLTKNTIFVHSSSLLTTTLTIFRSNQYPSSGKGFIYNIFSMARQEVDCRATLSVLSLYLKYSIVLFI